MPFSLENWPYVSWAFAVAAGFYVATSFAISHLHPDKKAALSLWLEGSYESTSTRHFCNVFDRFFGEHQFGLRCMLRSAIASIPAVFALWLLFDVVLGLISLRAGRGLPLVQALALGALINILPDYLSLYASSFRLEFGEGL